MRVAEKILERVRNLPEALQAEILNFVEYLETKVGLLRPSANDEALSAMSLSQAIPELDEIVKPDDRDFGASGLKTASVIRVSRIAVVQQGILLGAIGEVLSGRLRRIKTRLCAWIGGAQEWRRQPSAVVALERKLRASWEK